MDNFFRLNGILKFPLCLLIWAVFFLSGCAENQVVNDSQSVLEETQVIHDSQGGIAERQTDIDSENSRFSDDEDQQETSEVDPNENFNRAMYEFNRYFDTWVAMPISSTYTWILPEFATIGVSNFFANMQDINVFLNDFLQGKFHQGSRDTGRFLLNTTVGLVGLFDVATYVGLEAHVEDFDQTLAVWGVPSGDYLVLPFVGPFTYRGIPGAVVDVAANPVTYLPLGVAALGMVNARANAEGSIKFVDEAALDPYVFTREGFLQWREYLVADGKVEITDEADFFDEEFDEEFDDDPDLLDSENDESTAIAQ